MEVIFLKDVKKPRKDSFRSVERINRILSSTSAVKISREELIVKTPESIGDYSVAIQIEKQPPSASKLRFPPVDIVNLYAHSMPDYANQSHAITKLDDGYEISLDRILPKSDSLLLNFEFRIKDENFVKNLVRKDVQCDIPRGLEEEISEYWMHAQLKDLSILESRFGRLDLRDIDFGVNVAIHQDLKTAIPSDFVRNLRIIAEWIKTKDQVKKWRLGWAHLHLRRKSYTGKEDEIISDVQNLFFPHEFRRFVEVTQPFRYHESVRGVNFYNLPFQAFPKTMTVVSRTNLSLQLPAADGKLIYKKQDLREEISKILGVLKKKKTGKRRYAGMTTPRVKAPLEIRVTEKGTSPTLDAVVSQIELKLRPIIRTKPEKETEVQNALENLFTSLDYDFEREQVTFSYSTKSYRPDFTSDAMSTAIDVKLCKKPEDEKRIIEEINSDILPYKTRYKRLLFVVYDLGCIRNVAKFAEGIEGAERDAIVRVIKH
jgi:hypothetical protein